MPKDEYKERALVLVKPDGVQRGLIGEIVRRFEIKGLKLIGLKMAKPTPAHIKKHYLATREQLEGMGNKTMEMLRSVDKDPGKEIGTTDPIKFGRMINEWNIEFLSSGPVVAMVFEGLHAIEMARKIAGNTMPAKAELGTIRGDFSVDSSVLANTKKRAVRNIVHASTSIDDGEREIRHWFKPQELFFYKRSDEDVMF